MPRPQLINYIYNGLDIYKIDYDLLIRLLPENSSFNIRRTTKDLKDSFLAEFLDTLEQRSQNVTDKFNYL